MTKIQKEQSYCDAHTIIYVFDLLPFIRLLRE
jgi:hypothetical protein